MELPDRYRLLRAPELFPDGGASFTDIMLAALVYYFLPFILVPLLSVTILSRRYKWHELPALFRATCWYTIVVALLLLLLAGTGLIPGGDLADAAVLLFALWLSLCIYYRLKKHGIDGQTAG